MKICILSLSIIIVVASCVPPGKLTEAIEANNAISKKYDSIQIKLTDTIANFRSSLNELQTNSVIMSPMGIAVSTSKIVLLVFISITTSFL